MGAMTLSQPRNTLLSPPHLVTAVEKLSRLQAELAAETLSRAIDDASAAMAHQLSEPLTALLLYLHELKQASERIDGGQSSAAMHEMVDGALREAERVCDIVRAAGRSVDGSAAIDAAVERGRGAIDVWAWTRRARAVGVPPPDHSVIVRNPLTSREQEVLGLITGGSSNKEGAHRLGISTRTFEAHRAHIMEKLGARNAADLVRNTLSQNQRRPGYSEQSATETCSGINTPTRK
jgi:DNA-binding CsgD family transcriptional regulator